MNTVVFGEGGLWRCSCGAVSAKSGHGRFLRRHPKLCSVAQEKREFSKQLAGSTRSVEDARDDRFDGLAESDETRNIRHWISELYMSGRDLTQWEAAFVASAQDQFRLTESLSGPQKVVLERIYAERTH